MWGEWDLRLYMGIVSLCLHDWRTSRIILRWGGADAGHRHGALARAMIPATICGIPQRSITNVPVALAQDFYSFALVDVL